MAPDRRLAGLFVSVMLAAQPVGATQLASLFVADPAETPGRRLIVASPAGPISGAAGALLAGREAADLFTFRPSPRDPPATGGAPRRGPRAHLRDLIARAEAGPMGYDAVQHGARIRPAAPPTAMTLTEIFDWIAATPGQPHAIGRYQIIPDTLAYLADLLDIAPQAQFTPSLQDRLADALLAQAGLEDFLAGRTGRTGFMNRLAAIWAGLPNDTGRSHYHGYAGNAASISWADFEAEMARIFPG